MLERVWRKGNPFTLSIAMSVGIATVENSVEIFQENNIEFPYDPAIPFLGLYSDKTVIQKMHAPLCS